MRRRDITEVEMPEEVDIGGDPQRVGHVEVAEHRVLGVVELLHVHLEHAAVEELLRFNELSQDEIFATEGAAKTGITFKNTSDTEPLVCLRYFGPEVNPDAPAMGAYKNA